MTDTTLIKADGIEFSFSGVLSVFSSMSVPTFLILCVSSVILVCCCKNRKQSINDTDIDEGALVVQKRTPQASRNFFGLFGGQEEQAINKTNIRKGARVFQE